MATSFVERLNQAITDSGSLLCIGLDPADASDAHDAERRCLQLIDECLPAACAVKPNSAFFEQFGAEGYAALMRLRRHVPSERIFILDAKRGDIGSTAHAYARAAFEVIGADAITVNPLMGRDSVEPFLNDEEKGVFLLTRTSNPGAADFLEQPLADGTPLYESIARTALTWPHARESIGFVVGATSPSALRAIRAQVGDAPLLAPGVGAQGGDLAAALTSGLDSRGAGLVIPISRAIAQAESPGAAAAHLAASINEVRAAKK